MTVAATSAFRGIQAERHDKVRPLARGGAVVHVAAERELRLGASPFAPRSGALSRSSAPGFRLSGFRDRVYLLKSTTAVGVAEPLLRT